MPGKEYYPDMTESEKTVASYLNNLNFVWYYQHPVFLFDDKKRPRVWTPDFYLPALQVYLEVCGSDSFDYEYRNKIYKENDVPVVFLELYKHYEIWQKCLRDKILEIEEERHNTVMNYMKKI
jgi:hypothetical protein